MEQILAQKGHPLVNGTLYIWHTLSFISSIVMSPLSSQRDSFFTPDLKDFFSILVLNFFQYLQTLSLTTGMIHYAHNSLQLLSHFLTITFILWLGLRAISQMMPNYDVHQGSSEPALGFRWSLVYVIIWPCCSSRTFSTWINNFTTYAVKLFALLENKDSWFLSSSCMFFNCLALLPVCVDIVQNRCKQFHHAWGEIVCTYWYLQYT